MLKQYFLQSLLSLMAVFTMASLACADDPGPRARNLGIPLEGTPGPLNAITDVKGVAVGHTTLISGEGKLKVGVGPVRTGVTAILPRGRKSTEPVFAGWFSLNGNGEMTGTTWIEESGFLEGPVLLTNTSSVGTVRDAVVKWWIAQGKTHQPWVLPVVAETFDGYLNDVNGFHVKEKHVFDALDQAKGGAVPEGNVGGGTGMTCFEFAGGIGTSSRKLPKKAGEFTVGVLVQANFGLRAQLLVAGVPVGKEIKDHAFRSQESGSIIIVVATDAPLLPHQLKRLARRASLGLARTGSMSGNGSGDIFLAFSTANTGAANADGVAQLAMLPNDRMNPLFDATVQATEEAILNALVAARTMVGRDDHKAIALPHDRLKEIMRKHQRLAEHTDAPVLRKIAKAAAEAKIDGGKADAATMKQVRSLIGGLTDAQVRADMTNLLPVWEQAAVQHARDRPLLAEIKRLGGKAVGEIQAPDWLRKIVGADDLPAFGRIVEIDLNERTDGHKEPLLKKRADRVTVDWLARIADQSELRRLELSGTAVTSAGLVHLQNLKNLERLNVCLTAVDDRGFDHLAGLTKMKRMVVCSSKITGVGFQHMQACKQIESINLHSSPASDAGLEAIGKLTNLRRLEIVHTNVTDAGLKYVSGLVNLEQLHIHGPKTTETALPFLGQLKELYELDVYDRAASNQTLKQIARLPKLRMLMLVNGNFDDDGVKHLAKLVTLEELSLDSSKMTEASIEHLAGLRNLRKLQLGRTKISAPGRDRLKTLLPLTEIAR